MGDHVWTPHTIPGMLEYSSFKFIQKALHQGFWMPQMLHFLSRWSIRKPLPQGMQEESFFRDGKGTKPMWNNEIGGEIQFTSSTQLQVSVGFMHGLSAQRWPPLLNRFIGFPSTPRSHVLIIPIWPSRSDYSVTIKHDEVRCIGAGRSHVTFNSQPWARGYAHVTREKQSWPNWVDCRKQRLTKKCWI